MGIYQRSFRDLVAVGSDLYRRLCCEEGGAWIQIRRRRERSKTNLNRPRVVLGLRKLNVEGPKLKARSS